MRGENVWIKNEMFIHQHVLSKYVCKQKPNSRNSCHLELGFQKVDQHTEGKCWATHNTLQRPSVAKSGGRFKHTYELFGLRVLKCSPVDKIYISQCMGKIFFVEFQRYPLKFHTKYLTHTLKDMILHNIEILRALRFKSSYAFLNPPMKRMKM